MTPEHVSRIRELAAKFRFAILKVNPERLTITMRNFPVGSCGDASLLLAKFLQEKGYSGITYVCGWKNRQSHAWLEVDDVVIDITADQFRDDMEPVIVTQDRSWHSQFEEDFRHPADFDTYDAHTRASLCGAYLQIISALH